MANTIRNFLSITGEDSRVKELLATANKTGKIWAFQAFDPMPENIPDDEVILWRKGHWGMRWDATDAAILSHRKVTFDTPWQTPLPGLKTVSKQFPDLVLHLHWIEETIYRAGAILFTQGEMQRSETHSNERWECDREPDNYIHLLNVLHQKAAYEEYLKLQLENAENEDSHFHYYLGLLNDGK